MKYYLIGIKGTGMASLTCMLKDLGHDVSGSDTSDYYFTEDSLKEKGITFSSFDSENITGSAVYIIGNAYHEENCEVDEILKNDYEYYYYHQFIGKMLNKRIVAISGTHGKTTVASLLSQMLNKDCSYIIGDGSGYGTNDSDLLLLEACEYHEHFLAYHPYITLINNIELDHPDYYKNDEQLISAFNHFASQSHIVVVNGDDDNCNKIDHVNKLTFGFSSECDFQIYIVTEYDDGYLIKLTPHYKESLFNDYFYVPLVGKHMIYNYVACIIICHLLSRVPKLINLTLPRRRMMTYQFGNTTIIDDYAHHPTEIKCLYESLKKKYPNRKINVVFQPHTYSRTIAFKEGFVKSLDLFDKVYIEKVFTSKREVYNQQFEERIEDIFKKYFRFSEDVITKIDGNNNDVWVFLGAGVVNKYIKRIIK